MAKGSFKYVVDLSLLTNTRADLLVDVLQPYNQQLTELGVPVDSASHSDSWLAQLHGVLNCDDERIPATLQSALMNIADLASEVGHEMIVTLAIEHGIDLHLSGQTIAREDLAFHVYRAHPELFRTAHAHLQGLETPLFAEFYGRRSLARKFEPKRPKLSILRHWLITAFRERNRTNFCRIAIHRLGGDLVLVVAHGGAPQRATGADSRFGEHVTHVPERSDVVIYHRESDRLSISAAHAMDHELYRRVLGFVLSLDETYFQKWPVFSGEPLRERGSAALNATGIAQLHRVGLGRVTLSGGDGSASALEFASADLTRSLDAGPLHALLRERTIGSWTLLLFLAQNAAPLEVHVLPPNQLRLERGVPIGPLREFMVAQGFERPPPPDWRG